MFKCSQFRIHKMSNGFGTRQRGDIHGRKGTALKIEGSLRYDNGKATHEDIIGTVDEE